MILSTGVLEAPTAKFLKNTAKLSLGWGGEGCVGKAASEVKISTVNALNGAQSANAYWMILTILTLMTLMGFVKINAHTHPPTHSLTHVPTYSHIKQT